MLNKALSAPPPINQKPEISVLLAVYNTNHQFLKECIDSILNQSFTNFELLIMDDASTNNIEEVIKEYEDKRIKYFKSNENLGITKTRNSLLKLAEGKYIAIADHDDISYPERLEKEYNFLEKNQNISVVSSWIECFPKHKIMKKIQFPRYIDFLEGCACFHPACMWRKADFEKFDLTYQDGYCGAQDYAIFAKAIKYLNFANIQEPLLKYRKHDTNVSKNKKMMAVETEKIQQEMLDFLTNDPKKAAYLKEKFLCPQNNFLQNIFSCKNYGSKKFINILGLKIKIQKYK